MRSIAFLCLFTALFVATLVTGIFWLKSDDTSSKSTAAASKNYDFRLPLIEGGEFAFSSETVVNKIALVNFWATWCEPCQREFPTLLKIADQLGPDYLFILISLDDNKNAVASFLKQFGQSRDNVKIVWDERSAIAADFGTSQLPETYVFNSNRHLERKVIGYVDWTQQDVIAYMRNLKRADLSKTTVH
jgi:thiol-disulfide isomerase/thioredoxin